MTAVARVNQRLQVQYPTVLWVKGVLLPLNVLTSRSEGQRAAAAKLFQATHDQQKESLGESTIKSVGALTKALLLLVNNIY